MKAETMQLFRQGLDDGSISISEDKPEVVFDGSEAYLKQLLESHFGETEEKNYTARFKELVEQVLTRVAQQYEKKEDNNESKDQETSS